MKFVNWNVNGIRACLNKGFMDFFNQVDADFFCLQEIKLSEGQLDLVLDGYHQFWNYAVKKGYSGTAIFTKHLPISHINGIGTEVHDQEGRVITLEYEDFYLVTVYTPNSKGALERLPYRMEWEDDFRAYLKTLELNKPVVVCGDLNVAHKEIDIKNPKTNLRSAGFTIEERTKMTTLIESGFVDTFRYFYPDLKDAYTWWSYFGKAREKNVGWRIDYFLTSEALIPRFERASIEPQIMGSDHCPVTFEMK